MSSDSIVSEILSAIRPLLDAAISKAHSEAYAQGHTDAKAEIRALLQMDRPEAATVVSQEFAVNIAQTSSNVVEQRFSAPSVHAENRDRKRAPKGLPRNFVNRVLADHPEGVSLDDIVMSAQSDMEKMIALSTIRGELRKGREDNRYKEQNSLWYLTSSETSS